MLERCPTPTTPAAAAYRGTSLIRKRHPLGPYGRPMPRALWWPLAWDCIEGA